jgi:hypothetical protein
MKTEQSVETKSYKRSSELTIRKLLVMNVHRSFLDHSRQLGALISDPVQVCETNPVEVLCGL